MPLLPQEFIEEIEARFPGTHEMVLAGFQSIPSTSIRLNKNKPVDLSFLLARKIPWCESGYWLDDRPAFNRDPFWHGGAYYVQDASSMIIETAWKAIQHHLPHDPVVADLCAAPGGKSTHLLSMLPKNGFLVANEMVGKRVSLLQENIARWGDDRIALTSNPIFDFDYLKDVFDVMLVDAPCSGEGLFPVSEMARTQWSKRYTEVCAVRQNDILVNAWNALKPGGFLIYSTCTTNDRENIAVVDEFLRKNDASAFEITKDQNLREVEIIHGVAGIGWQVWPDRVDGRAFFMSVIRKEGEYKNRKSSSKNPKRSSLNPLTQKDLIIEGSTLLNGRGDIFWAVPDTAVELVQKLDQHLKVISAGIRLGQIKGQLQPHADWAFSSKDITHFESIAVNENDALTFLSGQPLSPRGNKGWQRVCYKGLGLGWQKNIGKRTNNYYPKMWRISVSS